MTPRRLLLFSGTAAQWRQRRRDARHQEAAAASVARLEMQGEHVEFWNLTPWGVVAVRRVSTAALVACIRGEHSDAD
jgi:hypothetical protein